jgi:hypothetical protein
MPQATNDASVRLVRKALAVFAREIGESPDDTETVMAEFLVAMMSVAEAENADFAAIVEAARSQVNGGF